MKAVVLVGGKGTRLRPLTLTTPKPLLPIAGQAFLERQLIWLGRHGVTEVALALGYMPEAFAAHFPEGRYTPPGGDELRLRYAVEPFPLGTAGGVRSAAEAAGIDERFVVCNGDVLTTLDLTALVAFHDERGAEATIHLTRVGDPSAFGVVPTHADGEVKAFVEKPPRGTAPTDQINAGTYVLEPSVLERIPPGLTVSVERETFPQMLEQHGRLYAHGTEDYWLDIGTPEKYLEAHADVLAGQIGVPPLTGARETAPGVWLHGEVKIASGASVEPPVLIGDGTTIASGGRVVASVLGRSCRVADGAVVEHSVLLDDVELEIGARARRSIIGPRAHLGEDTNVLDQSIVEADGKVAPGITLSRARIAQPDGER